jgi:predicted  nucleic acid-binding Zn-ribbon protein
MRILNKEVANMGHMDKIPDLDDDLGADDDLGTDEEEDIEAVEVFLIDLADKEDQIEAINID